MDNTRFVPFTRQQNASKARPQLSNLSGYRYGAVSDNPRSGPSCIGRSSRPSQHARPPIHSPLPSISNPAVIIPLVSLACRTPHHLTAPPFPRFPNPASAGCWTRDRGSSLLCLAAFRSMLHSGGAYTAEAVSNSHPGTTCLSWAASLSQERNIGDIPLSLMGLKGLGPPARYLIHHSENWYKSRQRYQIMAEAWLGPAVWSFKPIGLARWHISCH